MLPISVCIISLGRTTLYNTLESIFSQKIDSAFEIVIILQWSIDIERINSLNKSHITCRIFYYEFWKWFSYYRNKAIYHSKGSILAWIDDDEWTMNDSWLQKIIAPIQNEKYQVVTGGYCVELGQWYMTDCVSLLWWPGGWALGFEKMWMVSSDSTTNHLCTGNFAIQKSLLQEIRFSVDAKYGWEDNALSKDLFIKKIPIFYDKSVTVFHEPRSFSQAFSWWKLRAINTRHAARAHFYEESSFKKKIRFLKNLFSLDKYIWGKLFCAICILYYFLFTNVTT